MISAIFLVARAMNDLVQLISRDILEESVIEKIIDSTTWVHKADIYKHGTITEADYILFKLLQMQKVKKKRRRKRMSCIYLRTCAHHCHMLVTTRLTVTCWRLSWTSLSFWTKVVQTSSTLASTCPAQIKLRGTLPSGVGPEVMGRRWIWSSNCFLLEWWIPLSSANSKRDAESHAKPQSWAVTTKDCKNKTKGSEGDAGTIGEREREREGESKGKGTRRGGA